MPLATRRLSRRFSSAVSEYHDSMKKAGHSPNCKVTICETKLPEDATVGGVVLVARASSGGQHGEERLEITHKDQLPQVRAGLFPQLA